MDAQEAKRLVKERHPEARYADSGIGTGVIQANDGVLGDSMMSPEHEGAEDAAWIAAEIASRLSPQPEIAQGEGCPWRFPSECPDCNPKPDQQAQPQPAESDGFEEAYADRFPVYCEVIASRKYRGGLTLEIAQDHKESALWAWQASRQSLLTEQQVKACECSADEACRYLQRAEAAEALERVKDATLNMAVSRLGGVVEGRPTAKHNFLQRIDELVAKEAKLSSLFAQKPETTVSDDEETRRAIAEDRAFLHGMESGWNLGVEEDREEFNRRLEAGYTSIREASRELKAKDAEKGQGK